MGRKTLWEKEKLLVMSNFSFSLSVFKRLVSQGRQQVSLCGNGLTLYQTTKFETVQFESICRRHFNCSLGRKHCGKRRGENAGYQHFSFSHYVFKRFLSKDCEKLGLCVYLTFSYSRERKFWKICDKHFLLFPKNFLLFLTLSQTTDYRRFQTETVC